MADEVLSIQAHGATLRMYAVGGKVEQCYRRGIPYERPLLEHIHAQGFAGTAVDVGAGVGNHTLWLALVCGLRVVAFEPIRYELIRRNIALNGLADRVRLEPVALGSADGRAAHIARGRLNPDAVSLRPLIRNGPGHKPQPGGSVPVRRLDDFDLHRVSVVKADVEGMEPAVFRGGERTIRRDRPVIYAETWGDPEHTRIAAVLEPWGYVSGDSFSSQESTASVVRWEPV